MSLMIALFNLRADGKLKIMSGNQALMSHEAVGQLIAELALVDPETKEQLTQMMQKVLHSTAFAALLAHHNAPADETETPAKPDYGSDLKNALRMH